MLRIMLPKNIKICISTQHLGMVGGIGREFDLISDFLYRNGYSPKVMFSSNIKKNLFFNENFGQTMLEAGAAGLPIIATKTGIANDIVKENKTGFIVGHNNPEEIVSYIKELTDKNKRELFGRRIRDIVKKGLSGRILLRSMLRFMIILGRKFNHNSFDS